MKKKIVKESIATMFSCLFLLTTTITNGFVPSVHHRIRNIRTPTVSLYGVTDDDAANKSNSDVNNDSNDSGNDGKSRSFDIETARQKLENLLFVEENDNFEPGLETDRKKKNTSDDKDSIKNTTTITTTFSFSNLLSDYGDGVNFSLSSLPNPPPLSTIERDRRLVEIQLLQCLADGNDSIEHLWKHWYSERGKKARLLLEETDTMLNDPSSWVQCEQNLIELIDEYGIYFVEPVNRLATLYYLQGKILISFKLCQMILSIKPYHIGALSGIVQLCLGLRDPNAARALNEAVSDKEIMRWAEKRLPSIVHNNDKDEIEGKQQPESPRRIEWVERAVATAKEQLDEAERRTKEDFFGEPDNSYDSNNSNKNNEASDAWQ